MTQLCLIQKCLIMQSDTTTTKPQSKTINISIYIHYLGRKIAHLTLEEFSMLTLYVGQSFWGASIQNTIYPCGVCFTCCQIRTPAHNYLHAYFIDTRWRCIHYWPWLLQPCLFEPVKNAWDGDWRGVIMKGLCGGWEKKKQESLTVGSRRAEGKEDTLGLKMHLIKWVSFVSFLYLMLMLFTLSSTE